MDTSSSSLSHTSSDSAITVPVPPSDDEYDLFGGSSPLSSIESRSTEFEPSGASGEEDQPVASTSADAHPASTLGVSVPSRIGTHGRQATPVMPTFGPLGFLVPAPMAARRVVDAQEQEAIRLVGSHLVCNVPSIINAALPHNPDKRATAVRLSTIIAELIEELLNLPRARTRPAIRRALADINELVSEENRDDNANPPLLDAISGCFAGFKPWLTGTWTQLGREPATRPNLKAHLYRLFPEFVITNRKPTDSDYRGRVDIGLTLVNPKMPIVRPRTITNAAMFAITEAKAYADKHVDAFNQLFRYSRPLYKSQPDRRFLWGLTVCGEDTYVCLFMLSKAYATPAMNIQTPEGRSALINFFVGWSLCEWDRCGYDPSMVLRSIVPKLRKNPIPMAGPSICGTALGSQQPVLQMQDKLTYYEIQVHNYNPVTQEHTTRQYFANLPMVNAERLFSRHTRCLSGSFTDPNTLCGYDGRVIADSLLKTGWPESNMDIAADTRDECHMLRKINGILGDDADLNGRYPTLVCGGRARIDSGDGVMVDDSVQFILAEVDIEITVHRVHKRLVITPLGEPLNTQV
ncbi:hypothetical protein LPJ76_002223 [Coemansia sp. RSA 638]|nr:hypothetical protein LPJ76_002223 [Coemansia sp. RSA 638]